MAIATSAIAISPFNHHLFLKNNQYYINDFSEVDYNIMDHFDFDIEIHKLC